MTPTARAGRARIGAAAAALVGILMVSTTGIAAAAPIGASHVLHRPMTQAGLAPVVRIDSSGVTYKLPSGTEVTLTRSGPQFAFPGGAIHFVSRANVTAPDGTGYELTISAARYLGANQGGTDLFLALQRESSGPSSAALQIHGYDFQLPKNALQFSEGEPSALVSTGSGLADFGTIKLAFAPRGNPTSSCNGENERWRGTSSGTVSFTPQGDNGFFGTITQSSFGHAALTVLHGCLGFPDVSRHGKVPPCPAPTFDVDAFSGTQTRYTEVYAAPDPDPGFTDQFATFEVARDPALSIHEVNAVVPAGGVTQGPRRTATITAYPDTFLTGTANYRSKGPGLVDGPYPCTSGEVVFKTTFGPLTGDPSDPFTAQFDTGAVTISSEQRDALSGEYDRLLVK